MKEKKEPNQAPEPTPLRVTPAACAPVAPRSVAAHLDRWANNAMNADIIEKIRSDFPQAQAEEVLSWIDAESKKKGHEPNPRIIRCILYLAKGSIDVFQKMKHVAEADYRDVIMAAEYDSFHIQLRDFNRPFGVRPYRIRSSFSGEETSPTRR
jgi:hypothetical protein